MGRVAVVTDSTCDLGLERLAELGVEMVPLKTQFGEEGFLDWIELAPEEFYARLVSSPVLPTTSQPSPKDFAEAYQRLADEGAEGIVSIHLSAKLSGTCESAIIAARDSAVPVRVVDSQFVSAATGMVVEAACVARDAGLDLDGVEKATHDCIARTELYFVLETLDYLVKGGRAGKAQGLAASLLNIKPVLTVTGGVIEPFGRAKGTRKALQMMAEHVSDRAREIGPIRITILHAVAPDLAQQLADALVDAGVDGHVIATHTIGAVIGTHVGPKAVGVTFSPA